MTTTYQSVYQPKMGRCSRCRQDNIPEDELFLAGSAEEGPGWQTVCESCDDGDGSLRFHGKTIIELRGRDGVRFGGVRREVGRALRMVDV